MRTQGPRGGRDGGADGDEGTTRPGGRRVRGQHGDAWAAARCGGLGTWGKALAPPWPRPCPPHAAGLSGAGQDPALEPPPRGTLTSARVEVEGAVQDDEMQEQGRGVHFHCPRQQPAEELDVSAEHGQLSTPRPRPRRSPSPAGAGGKMRDRRLLLGPHAQVCGPRLSAPPWGLPTGNLDAALSRPARVPCAGKARPHLKPRMCSLACPGVPCTQGDRPSVVRGGHVMRTAACHDVPGRPVPHTRSLTQSTGRCPVPPKLHPIEPSAGREGCPGPRSSHCPVPSHGQAPSTRTRPQHLGLRFTLVPDFEPLTNTGEVQTLCQSTVSGRGSRGTRLGSGPSHNVPAGLVAASLPSPQPPRPRGSRDTRRPPLAWAWPPGGSTRLPFTLCVAIR